jgi:hypothetical protein
MRHLVTMCCFCEKVRDDVGTEPGTGVWQEFKIYLAKYLLKPADIRFSHTYCPGCLAYYRAFLALSHEASPRPEKEGKT